MEVDPVESDDVEPMEVDLPPEEEPMEVDPPPPGPGGHYKTMLARRRAWSGPAGCRWRGAGRARVRR